MTAQDERWMREALKEAEAARLAGEIPIGAVLVKDGEVIAAAHNLCETHKDATAHAELLAISSASRARASWRLSDCTLYVTVEPCPMCMGAAINARVGRIVYGTKNPRSGACESLVRMCDLPLEASPAFEGGVLQAECLLKMQDFFLAKRNG